MSYLEKTGSACVDNGVSRGYRRLLRQRYAVFAVLAALLAVAAGVSLHTGSLPLSWTEILAAVRGMAPDSRASHVVWNIRMPRTVAAVLAGGGLGVVGAVMQNVLRNPLASPFTIGVSQGAAFGAAFAIIVLGGDGATRAASPQVVVLAAFAGAMSAVVFILFLASMRGVAAETIILAGVAMSAFFGAATMLLQYFADDTQVAATLFWTFGDLGKAGWPDNLVMAAAFLLSFVCFMALRWNFNAMQWGDEVAESLGVRPRSFRLGVMFLGALTVAVMISFLGIIGFIGLMAPHLARLMVGGDYRFLAGAAALSGALLMLVSDMVARTVMAPVVLPVGIVTSFAGAPLFLYLLTRGNAKR